MASVVVLAVVVIGLDLALERAAEQRASQQVSLLLDAPARVDLRGWPVSLRLAFGSLPAVAVHAQDVATGSGVRLQRVEATLNEVRLRLGDLFHARPPIDARAGRFTADLDAQALQQLLGRGSATTIQLVDGLVRLRTPTTTIDTRAGVEDGVLVLTPVTSPSRRLSRLEIPLPKLPAGTMVQRVTAFDDVLQLEGLFDPQALLQFVP
jgi:LmeA-like phospholipid-binding